MQIAEQILQAMRKMGDKRTPIGETATHSKHVSSGEPDDAKVSSPVRRGVCGKVPEKVTRHFPTLLHYTRFPAGPRIHCSSGDCPSGLWHHMQASGQPFRKIVMRMPGPSCTENSLISKTIADLIVTIITPSETLLL